ncbi:MAG: S8 family serine peptidase [Chloroflexi bacterium]|nr:S8 family serine peptidase [Chloroflexota bacterium]MCL5274055.1 S8 family serine peptidase [Chloroflexota bacterium]
MRSALLRFMLLFGVVLSLAQHPANTPVSNSPTPPPPKITQGVWQSIVGARNPDIIINVVGYPDLTPASSLPTKEAKTRFVYETLTRFADAAQAELRRDLALRHVPFVVLWVSNSIAVNAADQSLVAWLASRPDVSRIELDAKGPGIRASAITRSDPLTAPSASRAIKSPQTVEWGVAQVHAPQVWALGYTGQGIVLADLDTGVMWNHPALINKYRGWNGSTATHDYNWYDAVQQTTVPFDPYGHGTLTTGTLVGDDRLGNQVGVAPGARWIGCRNMDASGVGSVSRYIACFQFALAPTQTDGTGADPSKAADITSNSWTCATYTEQGCDVASALVTATQALRDAGVMVIAAAGNEGSSCDTVHEAPATLDQAFSVGATDNTNTAASFSSRGPSTFTGHIKPDIAAPGVGINSTATSGSYSIYQGTSAATPHVAGVAALLWSAAPWLRGNVSETEAILSQTAQPLTSAQTCGGVPGSSIPNNTYGYGLIDALSAVAEARAIVPVASALTAVPFSQPVTFTYYVTNTTSSVRTNIELTASLPVSSQVAFISPGGIQHSGVVSWSLATLGPGVGAVTTIVITPDQPGPMISSYGVVYDGLTMRRAVVGFSAQTLAYDRQYILPVVMRQ